MLRLENISVSYRQTGILESISLEIFQGRFYGIVGPNGAGKTTLLKVMTGVKKIDAGKIRLMDRCITSFSKKEIARIVAMVPQSSFIPPLFTVSDVVSLGRYPFQGMRFSDTEKDKACVKEAMCKTGVYSFRSGLISELSGGMRQQVIIARALAQTPRILMMDEPTSSLDIKHEMEILHLTESLVREEGITAVMVVHDLNLAARFCDCLIMVHDKNILAMGTPDDVLTASCLRTAYEVDTEVTRNPLTGALNVTVVNGSCAWKKEE